MFFQFDAICYAIDLNASTDALHFCFSTFAPATNSQLECVNGITNNQRKATRRKLSQKARYQIVECVACTNFYSENEINRHWENMISAENVKGYTNHHNLSIKQRFYRINVHNGNRIKYKPQITLT